MIRHPKLIKLGKLISGFSLGIFLNQGINLLLIPLFWSSLKPEDFGIIAICQMISYFLSPIYMFGASETIQRFYYRWAEEERPHYISSFFWFILFFTLTLTIVLDLLGQSFSKYVIHHVEFDPLLRFTIWSAFLTNLLNIPLAICRIRQTVLSYNLLLNGSFVTQAALTYYMVKVQNLGAAGYVKGFFIANCIWLLPTLYMTYRHSTFIPDKKYRKIPLSYSAPLSFAGVIDGLSTTLDRFFLDKYVPLATIGFYNLARQFGSLVNILNSVTKLIAVPFVYKKHATDKGTPQLLGDMGYCYNAIMIIPVYFISLLAPELISLLDPSKIYMPITSYIPFFAISFYLVCLSTISGRGMDLVGVTKWSFMMPLSGAITSLIVYIATLPDFGVVGVIAGMLAGAIMRNILYLVFAYAYYPRPLYLKKLSMLWFASMILFFATREYVQADISWKTAIYKIATLFILSAIIALFINKPIRRIINS